MFGPAQIRIGPDGMTPMALCCPTSDLCTLALLLWVMEVKLLHQGGKTEADLERLGLPLEVLEHHKQLLNMLHSGFEPK